MAYEQSTLPDDQHVRILNEQIFQDPKYLKATGGQHHPRAIILAGQPGAGKGNLTDAATEVRADAIAQRKNLIIDSTMPKAEPIKELQAHSYQVEDRAVASHRLKCV